MNLKNETLYRANFSLIIKRSRLQSNQFLRLLIRKNNDYFL